MGKQDLIAKLEQEYKDFIDRMSMLPARDIIARVDVIAGMHYVLEYIRSEDFDISEINADISAINIEATEGILDDIHDTWRFELNDSSLYCDLDIVIDLVLGDLQHAQQSDFHEHYVTADDEDEDEMEL